MEAELGAISDLKKIANLPVGTLAPSMLDPNSFAEAVGDPDRTTWVLADGQPMPATSRYAQLSDKKLTPDLRGMFLRGMNVHGGQDPEQNRIAGHHQPDALQEHGHTTTATEWNWNRVGRAGYTGEAKNAPIASVTDVTGVGVRTANETRPKNVAVYFYIKIN